MRNRFEAHLVAGLIAAALCASQPFLAKAAIVSTVAGSGFSGTTDGDAKTATFMQPVAVAWGRHRELYVADAAAQRIRVVSPNGDVRTLAGSGGPTSTGLWVAGGYADGRGARARFNSPMGIAVGPDGKIYVADTRNHCIRVVTEDGEVTTFAGSPSRNYVQDGPRSTASFPAPMGVTVDPSGVIYVADLFGIRRIAQNGDVKTLPIAIAPALSISTSRSLTSATRLFIPITA
jgi:DNA-binding beta-propeller fold protein YncE